MTIWKVRCPECAWPSERSEADAPAEAVGNFLPSHDRVNEDGTVVHGEPCPGSSKPYVVGPEPGSQN